MDEELELVLCNMVSNYRLFLYYPSKKRNTYIRIRIVRLEERNLIKFVHIYMPQGAVPGNFGALSPSTVGLEERLDTEIKNEKYKRVNHEVEDKEQTTNILIEIVRNMAARQLTDKPVVDFVTDHINKWLFNFN